MRVIFSCPSDSLVASHSGKSQKVNKFDTSISQAWKVLKNDPNTGKSRKSCGVYCERFLNLCKMSKFVASAQPSLSHVFMVNLAVWKTITVQVLMDIFIIMIITVAFG